MFCDTTVLWWVASFYPWFMVGLVVGACLGIIFADLVFVFRSSAAGVLLMFGFVMLLWWLLFMLFAFYLTSKLFVFSFLWWWLFLLFS